MLNTHSMSIPDTLRLLGTSPDGLSSAVASSRLARDGPNALRPAAPARAWMVLLDQLRSVVVALLLVAAAIAALMGDHVEAWAIGAVLIVNTAIGFVTELRGRRAMEALLRLDLLRAVVLRDGHERDMDARDLVIGDVIRLEAGQHVPADARLLAASELSVDEAPLSGESLPVRKTTDTVAEDTLLPDRRNMVFKGTTISAGSGRGVVAATGADTEVGRIGGVVEAIREERTPLERRLDVLGRWLAGLAVAVGALVAAIGAWRGRDLGQMVETALALAIAAVPEGLPVVATIALAVGTRRMARHHALVRRLPAVETLGSVTVICSDKTGTLTAGEMTVTTLMVAGREITVTGTGYEPRGQFMVAERTLAPLEDAPLVHALQIAMLTNRADLTAERDGRWTVRGDPTDAALLVAARKAGMDRAALIAAFPAAGELPFSSERMLTATFHHSADGLVAQVKGAPLQVLERCAAVLDAAGITPLDAQRRRSIEAHNDAMAMRGLRVIALAAGSAARADERALHGLTFVGLVGMMDPPAPGVQETLRRLDGAGVRTVMITGDQRRTAESVAAELGILATGDEVMDGAELAMLSADALAARVDRVAAFSRVAPEDKLAIVAAHQQRGAIVAMLGDGVNDAAALKKADVGVAMGMRGTDVARQAAAVVLQDDRFATIGVAVEQGRVSFDNIRKFVFYLFSCNIAEVLVLLVAGIAGMPLPLLPMHILWLNLVTDTFPALALAIEPAEGDVMRRPPRDPDEAILSGAFVGRIVTYAILITLVTLAAFVIGASGSAAPSARAVTMSFVTLGLAQGFHLGNARRRGAVLTPGAAAANGWAIGAVLLVIVLLVIAVQTRLGEVLHTVPLAARDWAIVVGLAALPAIVGQGSKQLRYRVPRQADAT